MLKPQQIALPCPFCQDRNDAELARLKRQTEEIRSFRAWIAETNRRLDEKEVAREAS